MDRDSGMTGIPGGGLLVGQEPIGIPTVNDVDAVSTLSGELQWESHPTFSHYRVAAVVIIRSRRSVQHSEFVLGGLNPRRPPTEIGDSRFVALRG